jgi:hypothetical protein
MQRASHNSVAGAMIFLDELNTFFRIQIVSQMSSNDGTPQNSTSMTFK